MHVFQLEFRQFVKKLDGDGIYELSRHQRERFHLEGGLNQIPFHKCGVNDLVVTRSIGLHRSNHLAIATHVV